MSERNQRVTNMTTDNDGRAFDKEKINKMESILRASKSAIDNAPLTALRLALINDGSGKLSGAHLNYVENAAVFRAVALKMNEINPNHAVASHFVNSITDDQGIIKSGLGVIDIPFNAGHNRVYEIADAVDKKLHKFLYQGEDFDLPQAPATNPELSRKAEALIGLMKSTNESLERSRESSSINTEARLALHHAIINKTVDMLAKADPYNKNLPELIAGKVDIDVEVGSGYKFVDYSKVDAEVDFFDTNENRLDFADLEKEVDRQVENLRTGGDFSLIDLRSIILQSEKVTAKVELESKTTIDQQAPEPEQAQEMTSALALDSFYNSSGYANVQQPEQESQQKAKHSPSFG